MDKGKYTVRESSGSDGLNPKAKPFIPPAKKKIPPAKDPWEKIKIDPDRTLLMKFSTDFPPISQQEIHDYFTLRFENCIESLYVPERNKRNSEWGIITFSIPLVAYVIMGRWEEVVLFICTRPVRFKRSLQRGIASYQAIQVRCLDGKNNQNK